ncbi:E3 ubiquitin-protein ligase SINAT3 [Cocos nucifera]|uniref:RING-type E3 ubiquitin transferase n=1 Tax=Cocos nucifera TaxID=13894 RepID=A0A8K0MW93_COCNU|nr:E3 ubiquitin-protein ligase SINAT3 [Cocos nucifera]
MELDNIECISSFDGMDDDEGAAHHLPHPFLKPHHGGSGNGGCGGLVGIGGIPAPVISPATSVHELLECPVCTNSMYPPIHQLLDQIDLDYQLMYRPPFGLLSDTIDLTTIDLCWTIYFYSNCDLINYPDWTDQHDGCYCFCRLGCPEIFPYYSKLKHEALCNFRPYNCPYAGSECSVAGDVPFLVAHLRDDHKVDMHTGCTFNHRYVKSNPREVENATWMLTVFHCFGQYFCLHFEAFQLGMAPVYMAFLRFMGDENEAANYRYSLEVGANGRKLIWEGTPRSIRDSHRKVRDSHDGLIIQRNMALFFSGGDRKELKLRVTGRMWKEQPNPDAGVCIPNLCS